MVSMFTRMPGKSEICLVRTVAEDSCTVQLRVVLHTVSAVEKKQHFCMEYMSEVLGRTQLTLFRNWNKQNKTFVQSYWPQFLPG